MKKTISLMVVVIVVAGAVAFFILRPSADNQAVTMGRGGRAVPVVTSKVIKSDFADEIDVIGTAKANESIEVTAKVTEVVARVNFTDGQQVEAGQILVELTDDEQTADLNEARAAFIEAEQQYERINDLYTRGTSTKANLDSAIARRDQAKARINAIEARLADRLIRAPFTGVLGLRLVSPGTLIRPGDVITTLDDISTIKFDFSVPEVYLGELKPGLQIASKTIAFPDREFIGEVTAVDTRIDPNTRAIKVRAEISNSDNMLKPGMLLTAKMRNNVKVSLAIPDEALLQRDIQHFVYQVAPGKADAEVAVRRDIKIGRRKQGLVEVLQGLSLGDEIIVQGTNNVMEGRPIERVTQSRIPPQPEKPEA